MCEIVDDHVRVAYTDAVCAASKAATHLRCCCCHVATQVEVDFVDLNMGCPLDEVCSKGMGAGLMERHRRVKVYETLVHLSLPASFSHSDGCGGALLLQDVVSGMCKILTRPAVTLKMRIGVSAARPLAVKVITTARKLGNVNAVAVRSRQLCALVSVSRLRPHTLTHARLLSCRSMDAHNGSGTRSAQTGTSFETVQKQPGVRLSMTMARSANLQQ